MTRRVEIYRPHPDNPDSFTRTVTDDVHELPRVPGAFALCIKTERDLSGQWDELEETWRIDERGHVLRAVYTSIDLEHEPEPCTCEEAARRPHWKVSHDRR